MKTSKKSLYRLASLTLKYYVYSRIRASKYLGTQTDIKAKRSRQSRQQITLKLEYDVLVTHTFQPNRVLLASEKGLNETNHEVPISPGRSGLGHDRPEIVESDSAWI